MKKFITLPEECTDIRASNYNWRFKFLHFYRDGDRFGYVEVGDERHIEEYIPAFRNTQDLQMKCFKCFGNRVSLNKTKEIYKGIDKVAETVQDFADRKWPEYRAAVRAAEEKEANEILKQVLCNMQRSDRKLSGAKGIMLSAGSERSWRSTTRRSGRGSTGSARTCGRG